MTDLVRRARAEKSAATDSDDSSSRALVTAAVVAGVAAAAVGLSLVITLTVLVWVLSPHDDSSLTDPLHVGGLLWLVCHRATVMVPRGSIGVLPLGALLIPLLLCSRAGRWLATARGVTSGSRFATAVVVSASCYAAIGAAVAWLSFTSGARVQPWMAAVACWLVCAVGVTWGASRISGVPAEWVDRTPQWLRTSVAAGGVAVLALVAAGALVAVTSVVFNLHEVVTATRAVSGSALGALALGMLGAAYAPTAAVWGAAWVAGPGLELGAGAHSSPFSVVTGPLPQLPWLSALPLTAPKLGWLVLLVPVACGALAGWVVLRRSGAESRPWMPWLMVLGAALVSAVALAALAALASGGVGPGRLALAGPEPIKVGLATGILVFVGAVLVRVGTQGWHWVSNRQLKAPDAA